MNVQPTYSSKCYNGILAAKAWSVRKEVDISHPTTFDFSSKILSNIQNIRLIPNELMLRCTLLHPKAYFYISYYKLYMDNLTNSFFNKLLVTLKPPLSSWSHVFCPIDQFSFKPRCLHKWQFIFKTRNPNMSIRQSASWPNATKPKSLHVLMTIENRAAFTSDSWQVQTAYSYKCLRAQSSKAMQTHICKPYSHIIVFIQVSVS